MKRKVIAVDGSKLAQPPLTSCARHDFGSSWLVSISKGLIVGTSAITQMRSRQRTMDRRFLVSLMLMLMSMSMQCWSVELLESIDRDKESSLKEVVLGMEDARELDWREVDGVNYLTPVKVATNSAGCDAMWAFAVAGMVSDRLAVQTEAIYVKRMLSPQVLLNCATPGGEDGCKPETEEEKQERRLKWALEYLKHFGGVDDTCMDYRARQETCDAEHTCVNCLFNESTCDVVATYWVHRISDYKYLGNDTSKIKQALQGGPVACRVADTFAEVVGYTRSGGWIVKFFFGTFYGDNGFKEVYKTQVSGCWSATPLEPELVSRADVSKGMVRNTMRIPRAFKPLEYVISSVPRVESSADLPKQFDWRNAIGRYALTPVFNQHIPRFCGSCYAFASASTYSDRLKIARGGPNAEDVVLSAQAIVNCVRNIGENRTHGCYGGRADEVYSYMYTRHGFPDDTCSPYIAETAPCNSESLCTACGVDGKCSLLDPSWYETYEIAEHGVVSGELNMMAEIYNRGPIECMLRTTPEFHHPSNDPDEIICDRSGIPPPTDYYDHDVQLVGWGVSQDGEKYWIGRNSWGTPFADQGFFKLCRGANNMRIEEACAWVVPRT